MPDLIDADTDAIDYMTQQLAAAATAMEGQLGSLTNELNYLMTQWSGEAAAAYLTAQSEWNASMRESSRILSEAMMTLSRIAVRYEETERRIAELCSA